MAVQFYRGDWLRAQNIWRRWMLAHNLPRPAGQAPRPLLTPCSSHQFDMLIDSCASGGHRNDLETMRGALPFLRSDFIMNATGNQALRLPSDRPGVE